MEKKYKNTKTKDRRIAQWRELGWLKLQQVENSKLAPGPAFIQWNPPESKRGRVVHESQWRAEHNVPIGYIWQPATDWTAAGWVRERKVGRGEGGKERT